MSEGSLLSSSSEYSTPLTLSLSFTNLDLSLYCGRLLANFNTGLNLSLALFMCIGYSWLTNMPGGKLRLDLIIFSLSSRCLNVTDIGRGLPILYIPILEQQDISTCFAFAFISGSSGPPIAAAITSTILSLVTSYGSQGCSGIPLITILLFSWAVSIFVNLSRRSMFSLCNLLFSSSRKFMFVVLNSILVDMWPTAPLLSNVSFRQAISSWCVDMAFSILLSIFSKSL